MADLLATGAAWLGDQLKAHASRTVTYTRGADSVELLASGGEVRRETVDAAGMVAVAETRDWTFNAADLVLDGETVIPARGDRITDGEHEYEVVTGLAGEDHWRYSDAARVRIRVHTKRV